ncbi:MAG TPA: hypothetical protein VGK74_28255 [Symbiobacteriaceae bacterium]
MADLPVWPLLLVRSLVHLLALIAVVFVILPGALWPNLPGRRLSDYLVRAVGTTFVLVLLVYLLDLIRLYEGLTLGLLVVGVVAVPVIRRFRSLSGDEAYSAGWLDLLDRTAAALSRWRDGVAALLRGGGVRFTAAGLMTAVLLTVPAGVAAWERFSQALVRVSPAFSDAEVTMKWYRLLQTSYDKVALYVDGIYPLGLYTVLSLLGKLSDLNAVLMLQAMGPLQGLGLVLLGAAALYVATRQPLAAVVYIWLYGTMADWVPVNLDRHAGLNPQEFGLLFILPVAAFTIGYLLDGERKHALAGAAALGLTVLIHPVAAIFAGLAAVVPALVLTLAQPSHWRRLAALAGWSVAACALGGLPLLAGRLAGLPWHSASLDYAVKRLDPGAFPPPPPALTALALLATIVGLAAWATPAVRRSEAARYAAAAALALGATALAGLALTWGLVRVLPLRFLYDRGQDPAAMLVTGAAGAACALLLLPLWSRRGWRWLVSGLVLAGMAAAWVASPPKAVMPYRVFNDATLYQYLRIDAAHAPGTWGMVAGPDGYTLAIGRAFHVYPHELGARYRIGPDGLTDQQQPGPPVKPDLYFFVDRQPPEDLALMQERANARQAESDRLAAWIDQAMGTGLPLQRVYHDPTLDVWELSWR